MNIRKSILLSVVAVAFAAPGLSSATSLWYPAIGNSGGEFRADHFQSTKTRAQVLQELQAVPKDSASFATSERNRTSKVAAKPGVGKTRAEVQQELLAMSTEDKRK
jgi:Domain of unknown function (DUF4148)